MEILNQSHFGQKFCLCKAIFFNYLSHQFWKIKRRENSFDENSKIK